MIDFLDRAHPGPSHAECFTALDGALAIRAEIVLHAHNYGPHLEGTVLAWFEARKASAPQLYLDEHPLGHDCRVVQVRLSSDHTQHPIVTLLVPIVEDPCR